MTGEKLYRKIVNSLSEKSIEMPTVPSGRRVPLWFKAYVEDEKIVVNKSDNHSPSSKMRFQRIIRQKDFLFVYSYYERWASGEVGVRHEVSRKSRNTAYIFGLINHFS